MTRTISEVRELSAVSGRPIWRRLRNAPKPEQAYLLAARSPHFFFLDSSLRDEVMGRFSFVGWSPKLFLSCFGRDVTVRTKRGGTRSFRSNPFSLLRRVIASNAVAVEERPFPFCGGLVGFMGYDLCHFLERLPVTVARDIRLPDLYFAFYDRLLAFDHLRGEVYAASCGAGREGSGGLEEAAAFAAEARLVDVPEAVSPRAGGIRCGFTKLSYVRAVERAKEYIFAGDIFEVNLSQRFQTKILCGDVELYLKLRRINPAPFACHIGLGDRSMLGSSPELFLRVRGDHVVTRPIKGTRPRGKTDADERRIRNELLHSAKDTAELNMIVDLERNDLGKVCSYGSVRVDEHKTVETYETVHHLVGTVSGRLHPERDFVDLVKATFPGGSITGAPKVRAMEIIDELEPTARGAYTGCAGYIGVDGRSDMDLTIRTFVRGGDDLCFQVGGAVVADSDPEGEYEETLDKAKALFSAIGADVEEWR